MKTRIQNMLLVVALLALSTLNFQLSTAFAQTTAFTYQGQLSSGAGNANGSYDLQFGVYDANVAGNFIAGPVTSSALAVSNGLFTVTLDFGPGVFTGTNYWVEMGVRTNGGGSFATLVPRQALTPAPYAINALTLAAPQMNALCPAGSVIAFAGATPPPGWLPCNGTNVSRTTYSNLFLVINIAYGVGDGSTTFTLPDMRGRTGIGAGQGTSAQGPLSNRSLGQTPGEEAHTLAYAEMPNHVHSGNSLITSSAGSHTHTLVVPGGTGGNGAAFGYGYANNSANGNYTTSGASTTHTHAISGNTISAGGDGSGATVPHNNMQPSLVLNYIIKY